VLLLDFEAFWRAKLTFFGSATGASWQKIQSFSSLTCKRAFWPEQFSMKSFSDGKIVVTFRIQNSEKFISLLSFVEIVRAPESGPPKCGKN